MALDFCILLNKKVELIIVVVADCNQWHGDGHSRQNHAYVSASHGEPQRNHPLYTGWVSYTCPCIGWLIPSFPPLEKQPLFWSSHLFCAISTSFPGIATFSVVLPPPPGFPTFSKELPALLLELIPFLSNLHMLSLEFHPLP